MWREALRCRTHHSWILRSPHLPSRHNGVQSVLEGTQDPEPKSHFCTSSWAPHLNFVSLFLPDQLYPLPFQGYGPKEGCPQDSKMLFLIGGWSSPWIVSSLKVGTVFCFQPWSHNPA